MFRHTKTEVDCSPGASTEVVKKEMATDHAPGKQKKQNKQNKKKQATNQTPPPATAEKSKIKQPHIRLALSRAGTWLLWTLRPSASAAASRPTRAARQATLTTWRVERFRLATPPSRPSAAALSMLAGTSLPMRLAAAPRTLS